MAFTTIRRFGVFSVGKTMGAVYALIGLVLGAIFALFSLFGASLARDSGGGLAGALFGVGSIILFPIFYGLIGFLGGLLGSAIYNFIAGATGGIEMELTAPVTGVVGAPGYSTAP
jgi:uncharacterized protein (DUF697 family)